jgi:hypothetical protein
MGSHWKTLEYPSLPTRHLSYLYFKVALLSNTYE